MFNLFQTLVAMGGPPGVGPQVSGWQEQNLVARGTGPQTVGPQSAQSAQGECVWQDPNLVAREETSRV